jgi:hypothetical protein
MDNVTVVMSLYDALKSRDTPAVLDAMAPDVRWSLADGNPYTPGPGPLRGHDEVVTHVLDRLAKDWDEFRILPTAIHDAGTAVVVEGRCTGRHARTGRVLDTRLCHVWTVKKGVVTHMSEHVDTAQLRHAMAVRSRGGVGGWPEERESGEGAAA